LLQRGETGWPQRPIRYAIDLAGRSNSGIVVEGWIENARSQCLSFLSNDGLTFISGPDAIYKARGDVSDHLRKLQSPVQTDDHGVLLNFPVCATDTDSFLILRDEPEALTPLVTIKIPLSDDRGRLLQLVSSATGGKLPRPAHARQLYLPFFV